jgi:hypothetical protein
MKMKSSLLITVALLASIPAASALGGNDWTYETGISPAVVVPYWEVHEADGSSLIKPNTDYRGAPYTHISSNGLGGIGSDYVASPPVDYDPNWDDVPAPVVVRDKWEIVPFGSPQLTVVDRGDQHVRDYREDQAWKFQAPCCTYANLHDYYAQTIVHDSEDQAWKFQAPCCAYANLHDYYVQTIGDRTVGTGQHTETTVPLPRPRPTDIVNVCLSKPNDGMCPEVLGEWKE